MFRMLLGNSVSVFTDEGDCMVTGKFGFCQASVIKNYKMST